MFNIKLLDEEAPLNEEGHMSSDLLMPLQISIGEIEIPISNLIKLEQLSTITISLCDKSLVTLLLGGEPLATAEMEIVGEKVELKIIEVFLDQKEENSDNQEVELEYNQGSMNKNS